MYFEEDYNADDILRDLDETIDEIDEREQQRDELDFEDEYESGRYLDEMVGNVDSPAEFLGLE